MGRGRSEAGTTGVSDAVCLRNCARSSTDRAFDYGSKGWGFESLRARSFETATNKALTSNLLVGALFVDEHQLPSPPRIRGGTAAKYSSGVLASRAVVVGRGVLGGRLLVEFGAEPPQRVAGGLVGYLGVDLHRHRHAAVPEDRHGNARVDVEGG
jgi:hypothetical protein